MTKEDPAPGNPAVSGKTCRSCGSPPPPPPPPPPMFAPAQNARYETHVFVNDICGKKVLKVCKPDDDLLGVEDLFKVKARPVEFAVDL